MNVEAPRFSEGSSHLFSVFLQLGLPSYRIGYKQWITVSSQVATARDPDLIVHSEDSFAAIDGATQALLKPESPAPLLVVEIVSPGEPRDSRQIEPIGGAKYIRNFLTDKSIGYVALGDESKGLRS